MTNPIALLIQRRRQGEEIARNLKNHIRAIEKCLKNSSACIENYQIDQNPEQIQQTIANLLGLIDSLMQENAAMETFVGSVVEELQSLFASNQTNSGDSNSG
jgi:uncharacterized protein YicC (UPF0701 family)